MAVIGVIAGFVLDELIARPRESRTNTARLRTANISSDITTAARRWN